MRATTTTARPAGAIHRWLVLGVNFPGLVNHLGLIAWLLTSVTLTPMESADAKQKAQRKQPAKSKSIPASTTKKRIPESQPRSPLLRQPTTQGIDPSENRDYTVYQTRGRETLSQLLSRYGLPLAEKQYWASSMRRNLGTEVLPAGRDVHLYFSRPKWIGGGRPISRQLEALEVDQSDTFTLSMEKGIRGILFQKREKPFDVELKTVSGSVTSSLFADGQKAGVHSGLLSQLADIFTWDIDLEKDIRPGDSYKILYEQRSRKGQEARPSLRILAAELLGSGQKFTAIYFEKQKGVGNYYNMDGRTLARSFLRFPLEFTSITSLFTESRFHPMLKATVPHTGVDFAARRGTPVRAIGDGIIAEAGWNGGYGKVIDIKHDGTYLSRYAHLQKFAEGIRPGATVSKGQVIGFVGSTGRATGPHLHFELYKDQQYINPLSVDFPADEFIEPDLQRLFENQKRTFLVQLTAAPQS